MIGTATTLTRAALYDLAGGFGRPWLWGRLAWRDVRRRYTGSVLGSVWLVANAALVIAALCFVFARPLAPRWHGYVPYVAIGIVLWQFVQTTLNEAGTLFVSHAETVRNVPLPLSIHPLRATTRNLIVLAHNIPVVAVVLLVFGDRPGWAALTVIPALALLAVIAFSATLLFGLVGARFRDVPPVIANLTQLLFFLTPIFWLPAMLGVGRAKLVVLNPAFAAIDIVRAPLLGELPQPTSWPIALASSAILGGLALVTFRAMRPHVAYWV